MSSRESPDETDSGFRSGAWVGFYAYAHGAARHRMDLTLEFHKALVIGDGIDDVGTFIIRGQYQRETRDCWWYKTYPASHQVYYRGTQRGRTITGRWDIAHIGSGTFCIWPKEFGEMTEEFFIEETERSIEEFIELTTPHYA